jgi:nitrite reductase/ring-hydroxylating ferredoxin subunit
LNGSAAIHASCGSGAFLPPATTAASMRSRRFAGIPRSEKTVIGIGNNCSEMGARITLKAINDELTKRGHNARFEKASGYFYFMGGEATDWIDRTVQGATVGALTLEQWIDEFKRLKKLNAVLSHCYLL